MVTDIRSASHTDIFHMACIGELSLDQFEKWLDDVKKEEYENGRQDGYDEGVSDG